MSFTGVWKFDPVKNRMVQVSDRIPSIRSFRCYVPEGGYYSENLGTFVESRQHKMRLMEQQGVKEAPVTHSGEV